MLRGVVLVFMVFNANTSIITSSPNPRIEEHVIVGSRYTPLYAELGLDSLLPFHIFEAAFAGYDQLEAKNKDVFTIIDFTKHSAEKRMFVLDLKNKEILYHTIVSHGVNSGDAYARSFSNIHESFQSSLGFYRTENTYYGRNGYSLVIEGLESGFNDQARSRAVVIHGADYASEAHIKATGRLGRSQGCPALPHEVNRPIIDVIKGGSLLFIFAENEEYLAQSQLISPNSYQDAKSGRSTVVELE